MKREANHIPAFAYDLLPQVPSPVHLQRIQHCLLWHERV